MEKVDLSKDPHKRRHFEFFSAMNQPHFGITANVDISEFMGIVRHSPTLRFTPAIVYLITKAALAIAPFTWRIRNGEIIAHDNLRPSFTVPTAESAAFSFCTVTYQADIEEFHHDVVEKMEAMQRNPSLEDDAGADDYIYLSAFPWASFTSVTHAMHHTPSDSIPRITWGKYFEAGGRVLLPLGVQAHHAVVDGSDLGRYYQLIEKYFRKSENIFEKFIK